MMKRIVLFLFASLFFVSLNAQSENVKNAVTEAAGIHCDCINETYSFVDADVAEAFVGVATAGSKDKEAEILGSMSSDTMKRFMEQTAKMNSPELKASLTECLKGLSKPISSLSNEDKKAISKSDFFALVAKELDGKTDCDLGAFFFTKVQGR